MGRCVCTVHHCSRFGSVCGPKWARKHHDLFYPQTHCPSWVSRGEGRFSFISPQSERSQPVEQQLWFSLSFIILSSSCQSPLHNTLFRRTWRSCSVVMSLIRLCSSLCLLAEILLDDFMLTHPIFLAPDKFQQVLLQQYPFPSPEP